MIEPDHRPLVVRDTYFGDYRSRKQCSRLRLQILVLPTRRCAQDLLDAPGTLERKELASHSACLSTTLFLSLA